MAEVCNNNMVTIVYKETIYNLIYIPSKSSLVVERKTEYLENYLGLEQFGKEEILRLGQLVQLAYFLVADQADLQIKVRSALNIVSDLCDDIIHMLNGCKRSFRGALIKIQTAYEYLDKSAEPNALQILKNMEPISENLSTASNLLSQKCSNQAEYLLQVHHIAEKEKQVVENEVRKQKMKLFDAKKEKHKCEIQIKRSTETITKHNKKIVNYKNSMSNVLEKKEKFKKQYEKDIENTSKKCESQLSKLKRQFESSCAKSSKDSKVSQKKCAPYTGNSSVEGVHVKSSRTIQEKKVDHKLMQDKSSCQDHPIHSENKEPNLKTPCDTGVVEMNYTTSAKDTKRPSFNKTDNSELNMDKKELEDSPMLQVTSHSIVTETNIMGTPQPQAQKDDESIKVASAKDKNASGELKTTIDNNEVGSTIASGTANKISAEEANLQKYQSEKEQIELQTMNAKEAILVKYQDKIKKLDEQLKKLDQQLKSSCILIDENEQKKKDNNKKLAELSEGIAEMNEIKESNDKSIECISYTIAALYTIGSIIKKLGNFLREFASLCCQLNEISLFKQIKYLQNNKALWKSNTFKREVLYCYGDYLGFTDICTTAVKYITQAQEEVYDNVSKDLSSDEVLKLLQNNPNIMHKYMIDL